MTESMLRELYIKHELDTSKQFSKPALAEVGGELAFKAKLFSSEVTGFHLSSTQGHGQLPSEAKKARLVDRAASTSLVATTSFQPPTTTVSRALQVRQSQNVEEEISQSHREWKLYRVIGAHRGVAKTVAVDPSNRFFATGGMDNVIKMFDLATGKFLMDFPGHTHSVRALAFSQRHALLFSASEDKQIKCWDLERNQPVLGFHGHTAGVYSLAVHPTLDLIVSGGRDNCVRVWDMRTRTNVHVLQGHKDSVVSLGVQPNEPQITSGSEDATVRLWDLSKAQCRHTLTHHKRGVRALAIHPTEFAFCSASTNSIKKFAYPAGTLMQNFNFESMGGGLIHSMQIRQSGELAVSGSEDGMLRFWDWKSGRLAQQLKMRTVPGSLENEHAITALAFDMTGDRLICCVGDKSVQMFQPI
ncbi:hypothetical protein BASA81_007442 [Batrachochytrium salamandrivorans]|nr:hypothetical protein BASA81_007442 [Batrachochytrium salamandrivorans]